MRKSILRASAGLQALALMGAGTAASFIVAAPAAAQDYTSGAIITTVTNASGAPVAGAAVTMRSLAQGQVRNFVTDSNGSFSASGLTPGEYAITVRANGYQAYDDTLTVTAAQESRVTVGLVSVTQTSTVVVTGRRLRQTATGGTTGLNVDVATMNKNAPIPHNITGIALLAPTAQQGVSGFRSTSGEVVPTIGGSSVAENAYYINGLNITNPDTYVGSARVPFYFYKTVDVQTGGYPAEFGRATGAVLNATSKQGSNDAFIALHLDWNPRSLQSHRPNIGESDNPSSIGRMVDYEQKQATLEGGAAIVPDHLFVYGLIQANRYKSRSASASGHSYYETTNNDPFWGAKVDGYITPTQHAEFTIFDTRSTDHQTAFHFTPNDSYTGGTVGTVSGKEDLSSGGLNWVGRYTGDVTNWLTLSAAYGVSKDRNNELPANVDANYVVDYRASTGCASGCRLSTGQPYLYQVVDETRRRFYRGDADIRFNMAGSHHIRLGFDNEDLSMDKVRQMNGIGGVYYRYYDPYIQLIRLKWGGHVSARDTSYYIEDSWNTPLQGLTLNYGIRDDVFIQNNLGGEQYLNLKNNWGPRVAFSYTPPSMDQWKFYGSFGRYFIPPAMNLGFRGADLYYLAYYNYPTSGFSIDPTTGLPSSFGTPITGQSPCPEDLSGIPGSPAAGANNCGIYSAGIPNPALAKVVPGTKATYEDEFILGARYQMNSLLSFGLHGVYRKLKKSSEDTDFKSFLANYWCGGNTWATDPNFDPATTANPDECGFYAAGNSAYYIWNPGSKSVTLNDWYNAINGDKVPVTLTNLPFPKPSRTYKAIVFDFNRADDGRWMAGGSVTWSKLKGSTEGTVKSDAGNGAQEDAGSTTDFDYPGLTDYSYGLLPNDHRWQFKLFGAYHFGKMFTLGANIFVQSPMHGSCEGIHPTDTDAYYYGSNSFWCGDPSTLVNDPVNGPIFTNNIPAPRGTGWKSDWLKQVDLSARFNIPLGNSDLRMLTLRADVFNVFNSHAVTQRYTENELDASPPDQPPYDYYLADPLYGTPTVYQTPRTIRLGLDVSWGGHEVAPLPEPIVAPPPPPPAAPATQTCPDGTVILATDACPVPPPPPPPPPPPAASGERGQ